VCLGYVCDTLINQTNTAFQFFKTGVFQISIPFAVNNRFVNEQAKGANDFFGLNYYSHYYAVSPIVSNKPIDLCPAKKGETTLLSDVSRVKLIVVLRRNDHGV
jgi:hypothetical protein